jgi:hypothetical protein
MSNIVPINDIEKMSVAVAKSGLFGVKTPEQAMALMLVAQAEGMHPAIAARDYHVIQGRPALKADAMLARFQQAGGKVEWRDYTDSKVVGVFSHAQGGSVTVEWSIDMATKAGLTKNPTWRQYPRQMLRARCISEGIRTVFPGVVAGFYSPEEVSDFAPAPERDVTPSAVPAASKPTPMPEKVKQAASAAKAKAPKPAEPSAPLEIEGEYSVTGDPAESDLSGIGSPAMSTETQGKILAAFLAIGMEGPDVEDSYGKPMPWLESDTDGLRNLLREVKAQQAQGEPV